MEQSAQDYCKTKNFRLDKEWMHLLCLVLGQAHMDYSSFQTDQSTNHYDSYFELVNYLLINLDCVYMSACMRTSLTLLIIYQFVFVWLWILSHALSKRIERFSLSVLLFRLVSLINCLNKSVSEINSSNLNHIWLLITVVTLTRLI